MRKLVLALLSLLALNTLSFAQISLTGAAYTQNFDGMGASGTTLPTGWAMARYAGSGTGAVTLAVTDGGATSGSVYNVGTTGSTERALGSLASGSNAPAFGASFTNNTGAPLSSLTIQGFHEQWRSGSSATVNENVIFEYSLDATSLTTGTWIPATGLDLAEILTATTAATAVDGNAAANRAAISATISSLNIANGAGFWIRWRDADVSGSDGLYAVDDLNISYTTFVDNTAPVITALYPPNGTMNFPSNLKPKMTFSEPVLRGSGMIRLFGSSGMNASVDVTDPSYIVINGNEVTIDINLFANESYKVLVPAGAFKDAANNQFAGLDSANWKFSTIFPDNTAPSLLSRTPANNATGVSVNPAIQLTFDENITAGTGNILIKKASDNTVAATIPLTAVSIAGAQASFNVSGLQPSTAYYVEIPNTAFKDASGNFYAGLTGAASYTFTTGTITSYAFNFNSCTPFAAPGSGFTQYSVTGDSVWACSVFGYNSTNGVQINGFGGGSGLNNEDWFISPALNLTGFNIPILSFRERTRFAGPDLQVQVSTNYSGTGDPNLATWTTLAVQLPAPNSDVWTLVDNINLNAYKTANTYIAFKYLSSPAAGASRVTLDDIELRSAAAAPPATVIVSTRLVNFDFVAAGTTSPSRTAAFTVYNAGSDLTITAPASFQVSKDNITFSNSVMFTAAELSGQKTIHVRYAPTAANASHSGQVLFTGTGITTTGFTVNGNSYPYNTTLEVVNWNIEWFGSPTNGPADDALQQANAKIIMDSLKADIYAVAEIVDTARLGNLARSLAGGYEYIVSPFASNAPDGTGGNYTVGQKLAFIYKTSTVQNISSRGLLKTSASAVSNWSTGRVPYLFTANIVNGAATQNVNFLLLHAKANTGTTAEQLDAYNRRKAGVKEMKDTLDAFFNTSRIIILGDFNDDLDSTIAPLVSPKLTSFDDLVRDSIDADSYKSLTLPLSYAGGRSTTSYEDVIDHVVVSNEMFADYIPGTARIITNVEGMVTNYAGTTSDHYPVMTRYLLPQAPVDAPPMLVSTSPANNATNVKNNPIVVVLTMTFNEKVVAGNTGSIRIRKMSDNTVVFSSTGGSILFTNNNEVSIATSSLQSFTQYYVEVDNGVVKDTAGNAFPGFTGSGTWKFTTGDMSQPVLVSMSPASHSVNIPLNQVFTFTFNEPVVKSSQKFILARGQVGQPYIIDSIDHSWVTVNGNVVSVTIPNLLPSTYYNLSMGQNALTDTAGNKFIGTTGITFWTGDPYAPTLVSRIPVQAATNVSQTAAMSLTFSEKIVAGTGNILIKKASDNSIVATIPVTAVTINNAVATFTPTGLTGGTQYYIEVPATAFKDTANNFFAGLTGATAWTFTTEILTALNPVSPEAAGLVLLGNPTRQGISFRFRAHTGTVQYQVLSMEGRVLVQTAARRIGSGSLAETLQLPSLAAGTYVLRIVNNGMVISQRFVKQ